MTDQDLLAFKDGVADGLLHGERDENKNNHYYNQGYDYGITLYSKLKDDEEKQLHNDAVIDNQHERSRDAWI